MGRLIVVRWIALAGIATFACWRGNPAPRDTPLENRGPIVAASSPPTQTPYWCSISDSGYEYPQMPCAIRKDGNREVLAKLAGSQRFIGRIDRHGQGFAFSGKFYCPWGDCEKVLYGRFEPIGNGVLRGTFDDDAMIVTLVPAPADSAWGGATYGGDGYGGFEYGGGGARPRYRHP